MSLASIFAKFDDIEKKISAINCNTIVDSSTAGSVSATIEEDLRRRIDAIEAALAQQQNLEALYTRLAVLEAKVMPSELPQKVENIENTLVNFQAVITGNVSDIQALNHKLEHLESVTFPHVVSRLENVEQRLVTPAE